MTENFKIPEYDYPDMIVSSIPMTKPNQDIKIYSGIIKLVRSDKSIIIDGSMNLEWFPIKKVRFEGAVKENSLGLEELFNLSENYDLVIDGLSTGNCRFSSVTAGQGAFIQGEMLHNTIIGDKSIPVSKIYFSVPNLRDFLGDPVKNKEGTKSRSRLVFENDDYTITIDRSPDFKNLNKLLNEKGGYLFLYYGEITKTNDAIHYDEVKPVIYCFSSFLSFLNGRRCSPYVLQGMHDDKIIWTDFTPLAVDLFRTVFSWPRENSIEGLNGLWKEFYSKWKIANDEDVLNSAIHWYLEANCNSLYVEGSIILAQIGLELIYNWFVIENRKLINGKDAENISTANKIRLLLSQIGLKNELPISLKSLQSYVKDNELPDGIEAFVQIRNTLVHSQEEKRKRLQKIDKMVLYEAQELGLWYLELSILKILNYSGKYQFRCSDKTWKGTNEIYVPWVKNES